MKKIENFDKALELFNNYIEKISDEKLDVIINLYKDLKFESKQIIDDRDSLKKIFVWEPEKIKSEAKKLKNNKEYQKILENVQAYNNIKDDKKRKEFKLTGCEINQVKTFIEFRKQMVNLYNNFVYENKDSIYEMIKLLNLHACPYCNLNYIDPIIKEEEEDDDEKDEKEKEYIVRPHLDHFFPKSMYPIFALSFFNLIPCCYECNSGLKKENIFELYPYIDDFDSIANFEVKLLGNGGLSYMFTDLNSFEICLYPKDEKDKTRVKKINDDIELETRYSYRKEVAAEILARKEVFNTNSVKEEVERTLCLTRINEDSWDRIIYGNYLEMKNINKRPLAKLTKDLLKNEWNVL